ncbi:hypothetical protein EHW66_20515 [Erwinia psidii]|uniref:hypothetical protein n=1 Tax=Erwinia psidii TaxID=69224 RepID=UPI00226B7AAB|nr:hypothetical protein [Erwinia psidii]MCX8967265.1 hypothetical protein [Erwinia psidii]
MSEQHSVSPGGSQTRRRFSWRPGRRLMLMASACVLLAGTLVLGYSAFSLAVSSLDARLLRLESQRNTVATVETVTAVQSEVEALSLALHDTQKNLNDVHTKVGSVVMQLGEGTALRQSLDALRDAVRGQENRLNALTDQLAAMKKQAEQPAQRQAVAPVTTTDPAAKKPRPAEAHRPGAVLHASRRAPFVLTGVEKRGSASWAVIAPQGYTSLSQMTLMGEGETVAGWTLVGAGEAQATFRVNGRLAVLRAQQE